MTLADQITEVRRELDMRRALYPGWIRSGRLAQSTADQRMLAMEAVLETLKRLEEKEASGENVDITDLDAGTSAGDRGRKG